MCFTNTGGVRADCPTSILPPLDLSNHFHIRAVHIHTSRAAVSHVTFLHAITIYYVLCFPNLTECYLDSLCVTHLWLLALSVFCTIDLGVCGCVELYLLQVTTPSVPISSSALARFYLFSPHWPHRTSSSVCNQTESWQPVKFIF